MSSIGWWIVAGVLIAAGTLGVFLPAIPGIVLVFAGMLLGAWIDGFTRIGWTTLVILAALTALALLADLLGALLGAKRVGASRLALLGAGIGALAGFFFGWIGALAGPFLGASAGELGSTGQLGHAMRVGLGTWIGLAISFVAKVIIVLAMLAVFVVSYLT
ncbi:MAG: DUF456 domain-containing protein [Steroidobacteraceae bacterium]